MIKKLFASALFAGLAAAVVATLLQLWLVFPLIQEAELYETGALVHFGGAAETAAEHDHSAHDHATDGHDMAAGEFETQRHMLTFFMNFVVYAGFAFVMGAVVSALGKNDETLSLRDGLLWGIAGFVAAHLAPSVGLPPELPGTPAADIVARQLWWGGTIIATAIALGLFAYGKTAVLMAIGVVLILAPHIIGAPHLSEHFGMAPPELAALFSARSLAVGAAVWLTLGMVFANVWSRTNTNS